MNKTRMEKKTIYVPLEADDLMDNKRLNKDVLGNKLLNFIPGQIIGLHYADAIDFINEKERSSPWLVATLEVLISVEDIKDIENKNVKLLSKDVNFLEDEPVKVIEIYSLHNHEYKSLAPYSGVARFNAAWFMHVLHHADSQPKWYNVNDPFVWSLAELNDICNEMTPAVTCLRKYLLSSSSQSDIKVKNVIGRKLYDLSCVLANPNAADKLTAIDNFQKESLALINPTSKNVWKAIAVVCITAIAAVFAFLAGGFLGFFAGVWAGPGALITALSSAVIAASLATFITWPVACGISIYSLFEYSDNEVAIKCVAKFAKDSISQSATI